MAENMEQNDPAMTSEEAIPYEQEYETEFERDVACGGADFAKVKNYESAELFTIQWGRVPFEVGLERIHVTEETHKDLILNVVCNRRARDAHWRCAFTVTALCNMENQDNWESAEQSTTATKGYNALVIPMMRLPEAAEQANSIKLKIKIKINSWAGNFPAMLKSFTQKTTVTDAVLTVEGRSLYVTRAILAMHSTYFHTLFFDNRFVDAAKTVFDVSDVSFDEMTLFLNIIYPNVTDDRPILITSVETIEALLMLAERFGADCVKRLMEKYLMGEMAGEIEGFTLARRLLISDRFRLSAPASMIMNELRDERELRRLGETEEYHALSDSTRAAILDMRMEPSNARESTADLDEGSMLFEYFRNAIDRPAASSTRSMQWRPATVNTANPRPAVQPPQYAPSRPTQQPLASVNSYLPAQASGLHNPYTPYFPPPPHPSANSHPYHLQQPTTVGSLNPIPPAQQQQLMSYMQPGPSILQSRDLSWDEFQAQVSRVDAALAIMPVSLTQSTDRDFAIRQLRALTRAEFEQLCTGRRHSLERSMHTVVHAVGSGIGLSSHAVNSVVMHLIALVRELRTNGPSTSNGSKRRRDDLS